MRGRATRLLVTLLVTLLVATTAALVGAAPAYAAPVTDNFNRADSTDLGAGWVESGTELAIANGKVTNPLNSNPFAQAVGGTGASVEADVVAGSGAGSYAKLAIRVTDSTHGYAVMLVDELPGNGPAFTTLKLLVDDAVVRQILVGDNGTPSAHLRLLNTVGDTVRATVDTGGAPGPEFSETWTMPSSATGSGVGLAASGGATIDTSSVPRPARLQPPSPMSRRPSTTVTTSPLPPTSRRAAPRWAPSSSSSRASRARWW